MSDYRITLKPVYSCPALEIPKDVKLPEGWSLSWHQVATLEALRNPNVDVIFNTAMTGDGKSLAAYLETLLTYFCAIGLYPTNELARDQETQIQEYVEKFKPDIKPRVVRLSGQELEIYAEKQGLKKAAAIESRAGNSEILLSNPDIFHYLHQGKYLTRDDSPDKLWNRIDKDFNLFIFDEFHVFQAPQIASVINTMLLIKNTNRDKKFLFLSATPNKQLIERLQLAGFRCNEINPIEENKYQFPNTEAQCHQLQEEGWRQVSREISLQFISLESSNKASETWLKDNSNLILAHFQQHPGSKGAKGAIILNSIAAVKRLTSFFRELLQPYGLVVGENTGLSGKEEKERSLLADLVLGTSTIDVGVDFKINFLIFESADAGSFVQRLGRLGRHDGYERNGENIKFETFTAYGLIPNFLVERLFQGDSPPLEETGIYDRSFFHNQIRDNYRRLNDFEGYYSRWGNVQSLRICQQLGHKTIKQQYEGSQKAFQAACEEVFNTSLKKVFGRSEAWKREWQQLSGKDKGNPIAEDAATFRGFSPLQCGIYDLTESNEADRFKTYDLPGILSNLEIEVMTEADFTRLLKETAERMGQPIAKGRFKDCLAFLKLRTYREERLNWRFTYSGDLQEKADAWKVQVLTGIEIWQPENYWIGEINKRLRKEALVCYVLRRPVAEVRSRLRLPMHFAIYPISDRYSFHDTTAPYSIAFSQSALLLDTLAYSFKSKGDEIWIA
ncbi:type I-D CRISPR-associated helicase Cas3' [Funiculus sociatus GB2-A5]|uniref:Type I-D CRISPR-associated helicase Cas3 n=1 Tax=Funiculus sociatus GB2-A5 TaxID=2933946 RepID=A0ABV0JU25_9CYAN|nr:MULTISPECIES: type I-D CRISPR-associated helicase Cas3' [unclassified Trichocoleus]MBD1906742.1 type I-D CRISPR-associated helicase Cas3' [Trichocoleus sp. FACHB-832]MBD2061475.1 type I-D CRISPR-associated helicase Cas3' [Trichocoleus sp. FACHB-6]